MLESVLADVLTRVLGQYLEGIDRDNVRFGAWSGLVELRGVALRPEALAVLFETLGMELPVTVEAGFIGLLRLQVPWNAIGSTPVQIHMHDITIMARPVRGDGSDDSELQTRERRIKRARLATDDAVREASWGVSNDKSSSMSWSNWLVSEQLRAKIIDNIQIHLSDILLRFEDPFSDPRRPYIVSVVCKSLKAVSANAQWMEAFVERPADALYNAARKLLEVKGFHVDWAPITPRDAPGLSRGTQYSADEARRFETPEMLKQFMAADGIKNDDEDATYGVKSLLQPVDGSMRLRLSAGGSSPAASLDGAEREPSVDLDIRFPDVSIELDDVQYACLLQTSVYFARLATRGFRPKTPRERWMWAIDQMLPGFSNRREQSLRLTEDGILKARDRRMIYAAYRKSILKSRRMAVEEPKDIGKDLEQLEDSISYEEVLALRDFVDRQVEMEGEDWQPADTNVSTPKEVHNEGTTIGSFWQMLGYREENSIAELDTSKDEEVGISNVVAPEHEDMESSVVTDGVQMMDTTSTVLRMAFLLRGASVRLSQKGFPNRSIPRVSLNLHDLRVGVLYDSAGNLTVEAVLGSIDAWDVLNGRRMVYSKLTASSDSEYDTMLQGFESAYPQDVSEAIEAIRSGSNPAKDLLADEKEYSDNEEDTVHLPGDQYFGALEESSKSQALDECVGERKLSRNRTRSNSGSRDSTPSTFRVTESEFLGTAKQSSGAQRFVAAFRYVQTVAGATDSSKVAGSKLDVSVATLEAIVDGPKGSFVWGLKFWQPKGMAQDPIMAFLGAAAGARIAVLRMELEEALLADKVPMQINAVILAPRFIFPSSSESTSAVVVNMGILGICTSDNSPESQLASETPKNRLRYSNYVLTLDDLGMYFSPNLSTAVSQGLSASTDDLSADRFSLGFTEQGRIDTTHVERIIRPFSLRFILQTLRDANVVQVAHAPLGTSDVDGSNIAKVRVRGNIPGLYLIVTQKSVQHLIVEGRRWSREMKAENVHGFASKHPSGDMGWQTVLVEDERGLMGHPATGTIGQLQEEKHSGTANEESNPPTAMASYDVKVMLQKVSIELRDSIEARLITAVASNMRTNIVKTGRTKLRADFSLRSWSITDGSRGSTAAFRRLVYAGTFAGSKGVSPPRSMSGTSDEVQHPSGQEKNFVNIQYTLDLAANEQTVRFRFLSLNMVCVRETYVRLASFFYKVQKKAKETFREWTVDTLSPGTVVESKGVPSRSYFSSQVGNEEITERVPGSLKSRMSVVSEFDGFSLQLVASGGAIALVEMKDSKIQFLRNQNGEMKAWGDFRFFSIRDWTAPISDHAAVVTYEKPSESIERMITLGAANLAPSSERRDEWTLSVPKSQTEHYRFQARFKGIKICFLYRFSVVLQQYFSVLQDGVRPVVDVVMEQVGDPYAEENRTAKSSPSSLGRRSRVLVDLELHDLAIRTPRHSDCPSEAMTVAFSRVHIANVERVGTETEWRTKLDGVNFAVDYMVSLTENSARESAVSSPFLSNFSAEMVLRVGVNPDRLARNQVSRSALFVDLQVSKDVTIELCEAQYSVLYFVLTENLVESISGAEMSVDLSSIDPVIATKTTTGLTPSQEKRRGSGKDMNKRLEELTLPQVKAQARKKIVLDLDISLPSLNVEISRGWDVKQEACKVLGMYLGNVKIDFTYRTPSHMLFELAGKLLSVADLREEAGEILTIAVPVCSSTTQPFRKAGQKENVTVTYEKESGSRASIVVFLSALQTQIAPELFRDLTSLAIPGWPYLESSAFAPDFVYLGRTMTVVLNNSQVVLFSGEDERDKRAVVLTGEFQLKMDWMKATGAKSISLRSTQLEVSTVSEFPDLERCDEISNHRAFRAVPFDKIETPLLYPTDSFIEYVGPEVDDAGCRLDISVDSILCLINAAEIPLLMAILSRPKRMRSSYLMRRQWKQASTLPDSQGENPDHRTPRQEQMKKARENMALSVSIPTARYLITDEGNGRFVPILETRFKELSISAHMGSMFQMEGEIAMDLFNTKKGWWEPALESWHLAASISQGSSGSRGIVLKSERRLNVNITPTTVAAALTVAKSLKHAATTRKRHNSDTSRVYKVQEGSEQSKLQEPRDPSTARRPSVAAFLVRNELGLPIGMSLNRSSRRTTIVDNSELEVGVQTEELVSSSDDGGKGKSRADALKCFLTIPRFAPQQLSASEIGKHCVTFSPRLNMLRSRDEVLTSQEEEPDPIHILWEVEMISGVPMCTARSLYRIINETKSTLELNMDQESRESSRNAQEHQISLKAGEYYSLPVLETGITIQVRPVGCGVNGDTKPSTILFDWSPSLPSISWLFKNARESELDSENRRRTSSSSLLSVRSKNPVLRCRSAQSGLSDFFIAVAALSPLRADGKATVKPGWVDVALRAPIILQNNLPGHLSYRVTQRYTSSSVRAGAASEGESAVLAAGVVPPLQDSHLHFSGESLKSTFLSLAYENSIEIAKPTNSTISSRPPASNVPSRFGPEVSFDDLQTKKMGMVLPSAQRTIDSKGQPRRDFRVAVRPWERGGPRFDVFAGFWIRNRSDTAVEVCSRGTYYGSGSQSFYLPARPPAEDPDAFVCLEGPYLSIRLPRESSSTSSVELTDLTDWWTSSSMLENITEPMSVNIPGRSLEIEVRPAIGLESFTSVITIRNSSWICNNTSSVLQWCQASAVDSHGNCRTRLVSTLHPTLVQGIHWDVKSAEKAVRLRLASGTGQSDWIWSPPIPLNIGHSRELPAKMYRPKTHEQYIARVASKTVSGGSMALVIYGEDRQNPPYRIVNLCKERAIAFTQIGSHERPWLVRAGKTSRYSWDNPLARPSERVLTLRILESDELSLKTTDSRSGSRSDAVIRHEECTLNIDVVGDRVMVLSGSYKPTLVVSVSVDGATKIVTFCEEDEKGQVLVTAGNSLLPVAAEEKAAPDPVLIVGWDDIGRKSEFNSTPAADGESKRVSAEFFDYPAAENKRLARKPSKGRQVDTDAALFLDSIGISIVSKEPSELMYICFKGVLVNYEMYSQLECLAFHVRDCQVDNQLIRTAYPVLMWISPSASASKGSNIEVRSDRMNGDSAISFEMHRQVTDDDIIMIKTFQAAVRPFNICFEDDLISQILTFLSDTSIMGDTKTREPLAGPDAERREFQVGVLGTKRPDVTTEEMLVGSGSRQSRIPASKRIYVHEFRILKTSLRLTSSGSGAAVAKAAGINASARTLVALVLNVENCEFSFPALEVQNVFDSLHHFTILVKEYYSTQLSNQRMKLLASNALVGNPAALFDAVATGARDFFTEPGKAKGSADFIAKFGRGSKSLLTHTVGGLVQSVSSIPRAVSSGLEKAVGDNEYLAERERIRGSNLAGGHRGSSVKNPAQGLATGAVSFAHGISSGVTGLIREPVQGAKQGGAGGFFKGIGKAFVGGVAKPVAGAIDLVAEPAAGFSRQIADSKQAGAWQNDVAIPERPPRAFRGRNQRLDSFDRRYAIGVCLHKAIQVASGITYESELLDWIELSDRVDRTRPGADVWVWNVLQRYARSMPGTKKQVNAEQRYAASGSNQSTVLESRPEKTRVALISRTDVVVVTLDCKIVTGIPLWSDCDYKILGEGKEVVIRITLRRRDQDSRSYQEMPGLFAGSLISAPWDAPTVGKRRRPLGGEELVDRILCGSAEARDDLCRYLRNLTKEMDEASADRFANIDSRRRLDSSSSGVELAPLSGSHDGNGQELKPTGRSTAETAKRGLLPVFQPAALASSERRSDGLVQGRSRQTVDSRGPTRPGQTSKSRAKALSNLERRIRRLSSATQSSTALDTKGKLHVIIANRLEGEQSLALIEGSIEMGTWTVEPPLHIERFDAQLFAADCDRKAFGSVVYRIEDVPDEGKSRANIDVENRPQVVVEFFDSGDSTLSFTTSASEGFRADFERSLGGQETAVFTVRESGEVRFGAESSRDKPQPEERFPTGSQSQSTGAGPSSEGVETEGMSEDEISLKQLVDIGFKFEDAIVALAEAGGDLVKAVDILTR